MAKRNSPKDLKSMDDLNHLENIIIDKRNGKRADSKKNRRNRHYEKQFIKIAIKEKLFDEND
jgi:hypothetical protein